MVSIANTESFWVQLDMMLFEVIICWLPDICRWYSGAGGGGVWDGPKNQPCWVQL